LDLPVEIQKTVISYFDVADILKLESVCKDLQNIISKEDIWKDLYERENSHWNALENCPKSNESLKGSILKFASRFISIKLSEQETPVSKENNPFSWRIYFLQQYLLNKNLHVERQSLTSRIKSFLPGNINSDEVSDNQSSPLRIQRSNNTVNPPLATNLQSSYIPSIFKKTVHRIPILSHKLAKKFLYNMMYNENSPYKMTCLYPGVEGIGSGVGYLINQKDLSLAPLPSIRFDKDENKVRSVTREFVREASGFIFIVNTRDVSSSIEELRIFSEWISKDDPVLILCNADKLPPLPDQLAISQEDLKVTKLPKILQIDGTEWNDKTWCIRMYSKFSLEGLSDGMNWLTSKF